MAKSSQVNPRRCIDAVIEATPTFTCDNHKKHREEKGGRKEAKRGGEAFRRCRRQTLQFSSNLDDTHTHTLTHEIGSEKEAEADSS